ncbi:hypothetical protein OG292_31660 [Streptomyces sp. NBC_01511]|uniref:hypothetical protein n=1 Tax=Streptomyces sp. NBC_01511 TaxID=2903889 RepID=UPI0038692444
MTQTPTTSAPPSAPRPAPPAAPRPTLPAAPPGAPSPGRGVRALRAVAIVSCLPYITLKLLWIAGSRVGIPDGSALLDNRIATAVGNGLSVALDAAVVVLALLLTQPWGRRVPAWLLVLPMWVATGLLAPIMTGYPLQLAVTALTGSGAPPPAADEPFLHEWVFGVVYGGFIVQGLALGTLFVRYAHRRWGHLWQGPISGEAGTARTARTAGSRPVSTGRVGSARATAVAGSLLAVLPGATHLLWACGSTAGLSADRLADRTRSFHVLEGVSTGFAVLAVTATLMLAFRRGGRLPVKAVMAGAWVGSGALGCWGGWLLLASLMPADGPEPHSSAMVLTYAVSMTAGFLLFSSVVCVLRRRAA